VDPGRADVAVARGRCDRGTLTSDRAATRDLGALHALRRLVRWTIRLPSAPRRDVLVTGRENPGLEAMSSDDAIEFEGKVVEVLSGGTFKVNVGEGHDVIAKLAGKMRRYRIRVVLGDRVTVAVSPYDPTRGRITYRPR
jgi:translation initiation factor IF-1